VDLYIPAPVSVPSYTEAVSAGSPPRIPPSGNGLCSSDSYHRHGGRPQDLPGRRIRAGGVIIPFVVAKVPQGTPGALRNAIYVLMEDVTSGQWGTS
jgi:hypothetical protein